MLDFPKWKILLVMIVTLGFFYMALPNFLGTEKDAFPQWLSQKTVNLGLDLQGGSHLLLQVDFQHYYKEQLDNLAESVRGALRDEKLRYRNIRVVGETVRFEASSDIEATLKAVRSIDPLLLIENDGKQFTVEYAPRSVETMQEKLIEQSIQIVNRRVNETGTREPIIQRQGQDRILVQVPGLQNPERLKELLGKTAKMTFHMVDVSASPEDIYTGKVKPGTRLLPSDDPGERYSDGSPLKYAIKGRVMLSGEQLTSSTATYEQGQPVVAFKFNTLGARKFAKITQENVGKPFAIVLDNKVITAPVIRDPILSGSGIISGNFTVQSANDLALLLRAGALPAPLEVIEERTVGPSLGADSIEAGKKAAILGIILVMVFMLLSYGRFGIYADISLVVNMLLIVGALSLFQATLTLPGIAGIVLTFGMAVDANVLIFERIREEHKLGKSAVASVEQGFKSAFGTIMDANITTLIAAVLLFYFGSGTIKGFAVTLSIGIASSMFSAILFTRMLVIFWMRSARPKLLPV